MTVEEIRDRVIALEQRTERLDERQAYIQDRLVILEKTQAGVQDIRLMIERLTTGSDNTKQSFSDLNIRLDKLDQKLAKKIEDIDNRLDAHVNEPAKKWEKLKWMVVTAIATGLVGYFIGKLLT